MYGLQILTVKLVSRNSEEQIMLHFDCGIARFTKNTLETVCQYLVSIHKKFTDIQIEFS